MDMDNEGCFGKNEIFNPILTTGTQVSCLLVISHFLQVLLKPLGQPAPVSQILAGFVLGPSCFSKIDRVKKFFFSSTSNDFYETMIIYARITIMFLIGLETDVPYLIRNLRQALVVAFTNCLICTIFALSVTNFVFQEMGSHGSYLTMALTLVVILSNTASPFVVRLAHDLRFASTDIGRLAISSSLITDAYAVLLLIVILRSKQQFNIRSWVISGLLHLLIIVLVVVGNNYIVTWMNGRHRNLKHLRNKEIFLLLAILYSAATALETLGYSSITACFVIGAMFPRGGKAGRTLLTRLSYSVHNFILPIYLGYSGFKADVMVIDSLRNFMIVAMVILLCIGGKVTGTLLACLQLKIPLKEGVVVAFLMNLKGHVDLLALSVSVDTKVTSSQVFYRLMAAAVVINSLIWGPIIALMARREDEILGYKHVPFEFQSPENELKLLACVHNPRPMANMIGLITTCKGSENVAITPYLMHLIELPEKSKPQLLYNQKEEDELSDDDNYGGNDVVEINEAVDIFSTETGLIINQVKVVSPFGEMYKDVCEFAYDVRASIIILPFHKHQRIDGKLESGGKEGIRTTNQKIMRNAKCSVTILVDRGLTGGGGSSNSSGFGTLQQVAMLFFGGPDDREALGLSKRIGMHHHISLTVVRFHHKARPVGGKEIEVAKKDNDILMAMSSLEPENEEDNTILLEFFNRYVASGQAAYIEKRVQNGEETASALRDMVDKYSMLIVGKGSGETSNLTTGLSDWEECPELGKVGDFLASSEFDLCGSLLVVQQYRQDDPL